MVYTLEKGVRFVAEGLHLSELEAEVLEAINHPGWHAYLWFPIVYRQILNLGSKASDEEIHAAFASLPLNVR
jgi:hypothetical protein